MRRKTKKQPPKRKIRKRHTGRVEESRGVFIARWMLGGKRYSRSTGIRTRDFASTEAARTAAEEWLANHLRHVAAVDAIKDAKLQEATLRGAIATVAQGAMDEISRETEAAVAGADITLAGAFAAFEASPRRRDVKTSTLKDSKGIFDAFRRWAARQHPEITLLKEVTAYVAEEYARQLRLAAAGGRYNSVLIKMAHVWKTLGVAPNPWTDGNLPRMEIPPSVRRPLTDDELRRTFAAAGGDRELTTLLAVMTFAGARLSDACLLRWDAIDLTNGIIRYAAQKTGATCKPPLHPQLRDLLLQTPETERTGFVVPRFAAMYAGRNGATRASRAVADILRQAGIETSAGEPGERRRPVAGAHSLRHTFVSRAANAGVPLAVVQGWVGHMSADVTKRYFHEDERASATWAATLPGLAANPLLPPAGRTEDGAGTLAAVAIEDAAEAVPGGFSAILRRATDGELDAMAAAIKLERESRNAKEIEA